MKPKILLALLVALEACMGAQKREEAVELGKNTLSPLSEKELLARRARYADVTITVAEDAISKEDRAVMADLIRAAQVMTRIFWKQVSEEGLALRETLANEVKKANGPRKAYLAALLDYLDLNAGPWDRLDSDAPFFLCAKKPLGATFYPPDLTREAFNAYVAAHPSEREALESPFTVVRYKEGGGRVLHAVPYSEVYRADLEEAASLLRSAAKKTRDPALARFLTARADAFLSNAYFDSDVAWLDLGSAPADVASAIEVTIGPYEVYEDGLMNLKAAFEAFVAVRDEASSRELAAVAQMLDELEANLPLDDRHKNFSRGKASPIVVVNLVFAGGDAAKGVQTTAYNLPNDEKVRSVKGSKKVMLKNVAEAKFNKSLVPIAKTVMDQKLMPFIVFDAYFNHVLMHEVSHGLGPGIITAPDGSKRTVNQALRETYSHLEECKADVLGVWNTLYLIRKGFFPADLEQRLEATFLAGIFRSVRFGVEEAHGKANIIEFNYLKRQGAFTYDPATGRFGVVHERFEPAIRALAHDLLVIQAEGDYTGAQKFLDEYGRMPPEVSWALGRLAHVPVDIRPHYELGEKLAHEHHDAK